MPGSLGSLTIDIAADIATLRRDMGKATSLIGKSTESIEKRANSAAKAIKGIAAGLLGGAVVVGLKRIVSEQQEAIDQSAKFADVVGLTTAQFGGFQLGAKISGVELGQLNTGLQRFLKNVGDAGDGLQAPIRALNKLGLEFSDIEDLTTNDQISLIADRFVGLDSAVDKSSISLSLFGRAGINISKLLDTGSEGIERFSTEAVRLGLALTRVDAAKVESANDALTRADTAADAFGRRLTVELAPTLESVGLEFVELARQTGGFKELAKDVASGIASIVETAREGIFIIRALSLEFDRIVNLTPQFLASVVATLNPFDDISSNKARVDFTREANKLAKVQEEELQKLLDRTLKFREDALNISGSGPIVPLIKPKVDPINPKIQSDGNKIFDQTRTAAEKYEQQVAKLKIVLDAESISQDTYNRAIQSYAETLRDADPDIKAFLDLQEQGKKIFDATRTPVEELQKEYARLQELLDQGVISFDTYGRAVSSAATGFDGLQEKLETTATGLNTFADQAARNIQDAFADFLFDPFDKGLDGMLKGFLSVIQRMIAEQAAAQIFGNGEGQGNLGGAISGLFDGLFSAEGGGFTGSAPRVGGVDGRGGMLAILHPNETVVDHTRGQGGGVNVTQNFNGIDGSFGLTKTARASTQELQRTLQQTG